MRKLASIQDIVKLEPINGADLIEKATVLGWELVVKKGEFKVGDKCVYCEVDSILPDKPEFEFLRDRKFRIKTIKLRGQISQGICFPLSILPFRKDYFTGMDVTDILGIKKYDPQVEAERNEIERLASIDKNRINKFFKRYSWYRNLIFKPKRLPFPAFIKKTDEDRIQLFPDICEREKDTLFEVTEKLDGQSGTYFVIRNTKKWQFWKPFIFGVCSRNFQLLKPDNSSYWTIAIGQRIKEKLINILNEDEKYIVIQGEIIGNGIQGNKYSKYGYEFYLFNMNIDNNQFNNNEMRFIWGNSFKTVPLLNEKFELKESIHDMVEYSKGQSIISNIHREGIVVRNYDKGISFKVINPDFLLKYDE